MAVIKRTSKSALESLHAPLPQTEQTLDEPTLIAELGQRLLVTETQSTALITPQAGEETTTPRLRLETRMRELNESAA